MAANLGHHVVRQVEANSVAENSIYSEQLQANAIAGCKDVCAMSKTQENESLGECIVSHRGRNRDSVERSNDDPPSTVKKQAHDAVKSFQHSSATNFDKQRYFATSEKLPSPNSKLYEGGMKDYGTLASSKYAGISSRISSSASSLGNAEVDKKLRDNSKYSCLAEKIPNYSEEMELTVNDLMMSSASSFSSASSRQARESLHDYCNGSGSLQDIFGGKILPRREETPLTASNMSLPPATISRNESTDGSSFLKDSINSLYGVPSKTQAPPCSLEGDLPLPRRRSLSCERIKTREAVAALCASHQGSMRSIRPQSFDLHNMMAPDDLTKGPNNSEVDKGMVMESHSLSEIYSNIDIDTSDQKSKKPYHRLHRSNHPLLVKKETTRQEGGKGREKQRKTSPLRKKNSKDTTGQEGEVSKKRPKSKSPHRKKSSNNKDNSSSRKGVAKPVLIDKADLKRITSWTPKFSDDDDDDFFSQWENDSDDYSRYDSKSFPPPSLVPSTGASGPLSNVQLSQWLEGSGAKPSAHTISQKGANVGERLRTSSVGFHIENSLRWTNTPQQEVTSITNASQGEGTEMCTQQPPSPSPLQKKNTKRIQKPKIVEKQESVSVVIARKIKENPRLLNHFLKLINGESSISDDEQSLTASLVADCMVPSVPVPLQTYRRGIVLRRRGSERAPRRRRSSSCHQLDRLKPVFGRASGHLANSELDIARKTDLELGLLCATKRTPEGDNPLQRRRQRHVKRLLTD